MHKSTPPRLSVSYSSLLRVYKSGPESLGVEESVRNFSRNSRDIFADAFHADLKLSTLTDFAVRTQLHVHTHTEQRNTSSAAVWARIVKRDQRSVVHGFQHSRTMNFWIDYTASIITMLNFDRKTLIRSDNDSFHRVTSFVHYRRMNFHGSLIFR